MTKKTKNKDVTKEVLKEDEKWYGLEKKFWTVVEFGVYVILLTFTAIAIGSQYQSLKADKNIIIDEGAKQMAMDEDGITYYINDICPEEECETTFSALHKGKDVDVKYESNSTETKLTIGKTIIENSIPLKQFAILSNGFIATVESNEGKASTVRYYDKEGNEIHSFVTYLDISKSLGSIKGVYGSCDIPENTTGDDQTLNIVEYEIEEDGSFTENIVGTFENSHCQD